jgi:hypothetical protein
MEIIFSLLLESRPGVLYMFRSLGRRDVIGVVSCTAGTQLIAVGSGDDVIAFPPAEHAKFVVLVTLP